MSEQALSVDTTTFRRVLGRFTTGVAAVTALATDTAQPVGLTVNSFTSVSLDPPLVSFCVARASSSWPALREAGRLCVNILGQDQQQLSAQLSSPDRDARFHGVHWTAAPGGAPLLTGAIAWIGGAVEAELPAGDHLIVLVRVLDLGEQDNDRPLLFFRGRYGRLHS